MIKRTLFKLVIGFTTVLISCDTQPQKPNIVFIAVDDLRADLGCYGNSMVHSPNLDRLASQGVLFKNHFVNVPTCGPSRYCLLTGMRPTTRAHLRNDITEKVISNKPESPHPETFIHLLRQTGYHTVGIGKISHSADGYLYGYTEKTSTKKELPHSWDELIFDYGKWGTGWNAFFGYANGENRQSLNSQVRPYEKGNVEDTGYVDGLTRQLAISKLNELKISSKPFFLGIGFFKPHLPFNSPEKYWNLYDPDSIPISPNPIIPDDIHIKSLHESDEFNRYALGDEKATLSHPLSPEYARKLRHAYYSCISYIDRQIGLIVEEINSLGLANNTIIVVWGDHGWHLGDQQVWGKHTLFENALKSTLIVKLPGDNPVKSVSSVIETVDIYPTLLELCGVALPNRVDGASFASLFNNSRDIQNDNVAYGYFKEGISLRTAKYRLTRYYRDEEPKIELYDHETDPLESVNIASKHPQIVDRLMPLLDQGNTGLYD